MIDSTKPTFRLYGCGGCGINIVTPFTRKTLGEGYSEVKVGLIDTSTSNFTNEHKENGVDFFLATNDGEGSGKVRRDNASVISDNVNRALLVQKPADFNVVIFSASGGSGSVIGPLLMKELLERGIPCVGIIVGSSESSITATNSLNTLKSLAAIGASLDKPCIISYQHNSNENRRSAVDATCTAFIHTLAALCSSENDELDQRDVRNWAFYNHSTSVPAQLSLLEICDTVEAAKEIQSPISVASLLTDKDAVAPDLMPEYSCIGYRLEGLEDGLTEMHYVISVDGITELMKYRQDSVNDYGQSTSARSSNAKVILTDKDKVDVGTGLIL
jgi:hypothetical protein